MQKKSRNLKATGFARWQAQQMQRVAPMDELRVLLRKSRYRPAY
ncbi:hypothetical protein [uncultured Microscilla sp.]|nr:hypothetical protein [uncultured Microscilla sp.]